MALYKDVTRKRMPGGSGGKLQAMGETSENVRHRSNAGFTLVETLLSLAILVVLTGLVAMGVPAAFSSYSKTVDSSNAQVILTNATTVLRNELGLASEVWYAYESDADGTQEQVVKGFCTSEGNIAEIPDPKNQPVISNSDESNVSTDSQQKEIPRIYYKKGWIPGNDYDTSYSEYIAKRDLVPEIAIDDNRYEADNLKLTIGKITFEDKGGVFIVNDLKVVDKDGHELAVIDAYKVKAMAGIIPHDASASMSGSEG